MDLKLISKLTVYSLISILLFASCNSDNEIDEYAQSSDGQIRSFVLTAISRNAADSLAYIPMAKTTFVVDNKGGYRIFNPDSLPQQIDKKKVHAKLEFSSTPARIELIYKDKNGKDSIPEVSWGETDSILFVKDNVGYLPRFKVIAPNGTQREYSVNFNIHKSDPDSIIWNSVTDFELLKKGDSKTIISADSTKFCTLTKDGTEVHFYTSTITEDNPSWNSSQKTNLPANTIVKSLKTIGDSFVILADDGSLYAAKIADPINWTKYENSKVLALIEVLPKLMPSDADELLVIYTNNENKTVFAKTKITDLRSFVELELKGRSDNAVPTDFPIANFSTVLAAKLGFESILVTGGSDSNSTPSRRTWSINSSTSTEINIFKGANDPIAKYDKYVSTFIYNKGVYMVANDSLYTSNSYGDRWVKANTKQEITKMVKEGRHMPSIVVDKNDHVWIFGGKSTANQYLKDVWRGRLNKLAFAHKK